jgi:hypothetical protein
MWSIIKGITMLRVSRITVAIIILTFLCLSQVFAAESATPGKLDDDAVHALIVFISQMTRVLEAVLETDISPGLRAEILKALQKCAEIQMVLRKEE